MSWLTSFFSWVFGLFGGPPAPDSAQVVAIQAAAVKACGFLPMAESVVALLGTVNPAVTTASAIASQICAAVAKAKPTAVLAGMGGGTPLTVTTNGVQIEGILIK